MYKRMVSKIVNFVCFILLSIQSSFFLIYFLFGFVLQIIKILEHRISGLLIIILLFGILSNVISFYFLISVALGLISFPLLILFRATKYFFTKITKISIFFRLIYGYLALIIGIFIYLNFVGLVASSLHLVLFLLFSSLLFALNSFMLFNGFRRWYICLMITVTQVLVLFLLRFSILLLITIFGIFLVYLLGFMIAAFFHRKVIYYIENMNYGFLVWLKTFLLSLAVITLRLACSDSFMPSDIYILGPLPLFLVGSNGSLNSGVLFFSKSFSTQNHVPILAIKNCNKHESELLQAVWSGNGKSILQKAHNLVKSGNWISTRTEIQTIRNNFIRANNVSFDYGVNKEISNFVKTKGVIFEVDSIASSQVLLKHVLRMYKNGGISNGSNNFTDHVISKDKKTGIITAENKMCLSPFGGRLVGVSINNFEIIRSLNELPQLMELSYRTGLLSKVYRPGEILGDWYTQDSKGNLCFTETKTYSNLSNTDYLEYVSKQELNLFLNEIKYNSDLTSSVYLDGRILKEAFNIWSKGKLTGNDMELMVYVASEDDIFLSSEFNIPNTDKNKMYLNVRPLKNMLDLEDRLLYDVRGLSCEEYNQKEFQNYLETDRKVKIAEAKLKNKLENETYI